MEEFDDDDNPGKGKNFENTTLKSSSSISPDGHSVLKPRYNFRSVLGENLHYRIIWKLKVLRIICYFFTNPVFSDNAFMSGGL